MVFVTVGSQKFQFDRLLQAVDACVERGAMEGRVFVQSGFCTYEPRRAEWRPFLSRGEFAEMMGAADVVVTHGGTGAIVGALKLGKKVVAVPRLVRFDEHVDDHQIEIVEAFAAQGYIEACMDPDGLAQAYAKALTGKFEPFTSNSAAFMADLDGYFETVGVRP